jgi:hypothetical protein
MVSVTAIAISSFCFLGIAPSAHAVLLKVQEDFARFGRLNLQMFQPAKVLHVIHGDLS